MVGLSYEQYWDYPPVIVHKFIEAYEERQKNFLIIQDKLNYLLGKYIAFSFNKPESYPDKPFLEHLATDSGNKVENMTDKEMEAIAKRNTVVLGGIIQEK